MSIVYCAVKSVSRVIAEAMYWTVRADIEYVLWVTRLALIVSTRTPCLFVWMESQASGSRPCP